ncbi:hypothetical protein [Streptomyces sp. NPDC093111]|uniref:hypothetical protein n=1 Tax=Streptomyces sp. NPDC093111 TaxID=3154978 RepID=UPI003448E638
MFTAVFQDHYGYLAVSALIALALGAAAWRLARRRHNPRGLWLAGLAATDTMAPNG